MADESTQEMLFPLKGLYLSSEFVNQPELSAVDGVNVQTFDPLKNRERGGSRIGLRKYDATQISGGNPVQMLNYIVDPTLDGTVPPGSGFPDPTVPPIPPGGGGEVSPGGSGGTPNPTRPPLPPTVARDDTLSVNVGDDPIDNDVLTNDTYAGTPNITIVSGPSLSGATAFVTGSGRFARIVYTPPADGDGGTDAVVYRLGATESGTSSTATLHVTVGAEAGPDPHPGTYSGTILTTSCGLDSAYTPRMRITTVWNGVPGTSVLIVWIADADDIPFFDPPPGAVILVDEAVRIADCGFTVNFHPGDHVHLVITGGTSNGGFTGSVSGA